MTTAADPAASRKRGRSDMAPCAAWEPKQVTPTVALDLRHAALGPRGYKLKPVKTGYSSLKKMQQAEQEQQQQQQPEQQPEAMQRDGDGDNDEDAGAVYLKPAVKRQRAEGVAYRNVSGKVWKAEAPKRASADKNTLVGTSWEKKMKERAVRKAFLEQKAAALDARKEKRKADAKHRQAVKDRKKANQEKSAQVQKITNSATLKKMMKSKKQRKMLRTADVS